MTLEDIQNMWSKDCKIDELNLGQESIKTPELHAKYLNLLSTYKLQLRKNESKLLSLRKIKWRYYRGELSHTELDDLGWDQYLGATPLKNEMADFLDSDGDVIKATDRVEYIRTINYQLEAILRSISSRGWDIKNAVEWTKFTNGLM